MTRLLVQHLLAFDLLLAWHGTDCAASCMTCQNCRLGVCPVYLLEAVILPFASLTPVFDLAQPLPWRVPVAGGW